MKTETGPETLEILNDGLDGGRIMAWMLFPNRPDLREAHFVRELTRQAVDRAESPAAMIEISAGTLRALLASPGAEELSSLAAEATKRGTVAGDLLSLVYQLQQSGADRPSLRKAIGLYKEFALGQKYGDGTALKYSDQTLRNHWAEFTKVAHLWAAFRLNQGPYAFAPEQGAIFHEPAATRMFLGIAKAIAEFASTFIPKGTKPPKPVLCADDLLVIPGGIPAVRLKLPQD